MGKVWGFRRYFWVWALMGGQVGRVGGVGGVGVEGRGGEGMRGLDWLR